MWYHPSDARVARVLYKSALSSKLVSTLNATVMTHLSIVLNFNMKVWLNMRYISNCKLYIKLENKTQFERKAIQVSHDLKLINTTVSGTTFYVKKVNHD